jgi:tRNA1Val (adenine37-N6)-methyltransferase
MSIFKFKHFSVQQANSAMKIGTDAMVFGAMLPVLNKKKALDVGTGTGVLSLMSAQKNQLIQIDAIEIEQAAYEEAKLNVQNSDFKQQIKVFQGDFLQYHKEESYDLIFSNPPYFENSSKSDNRSKNVARHNDYLPFDLFFQKATSLLSDEGDFLLIVPYSLKENLLQLATINMLFLNKLVNIYGKPSNLNRVVLNFSKKESALKTANFIIRTEEGAYTSEYKDLTKEFHGVAI